MHVQQQQQKPTSTVSLEVLYLIMYHLFLPFEAFEHILWLPVQCFYGIPKYVNKWVSASQVSSWGLFLLFALSYSDVLLSIFHIRFHFTIILQKPVCFLTKDQIGVDPHGRRGGDKMELGRIDGGGIVIRIYCITKNLFSINGKINKTNTSLAIFGLLLAHYLFPTPLCLSLQVK